MDDNELKIAALQQRNTQLIARYENDIVELQIALHRASERIDELQASAEESND